MFLQIDLEKNCYTTVNFTFSVPSRYCSCCRKNTTANQVLMIAIILLAGISIMKEVNDVFLVNSYNKNDRNL